MADHRGRASDYAWVDQRENDRASEPGGISLIRTTLEIASTLENREAVPPLIQAEVALNPQAAMSDLVRVPERAASPLP